MRKTMKKFAAVMLAILMSLSLFALPAMAEGGSASEILPEAAADLNEALNVPGGTLTFVSEGTYPWVVEEDWAKSTNEGIAYSESTVSTTVTAVEGDIVQFDFQCWGEGAYTTHWDKLQLKIDGTAIIDWGEGPKEWTTYATALTAGEHNIEWTYKKDGSYNEPGDHAFLDNVYVGAPVTPTEINVEDLTVSGNRHAQLIWEVLPEDAFDKSVTFTVEDETIAVVDSTGLVTGMGIGETTVTVTSVADPEVFGTATITVPDMLTDPILDEALNVEGGGLHFFTEAPYPWVVPEGESYAKSTNELIPNSSSTISTTVAAHEGDILQFDFQCWGEGADTYDWDNLKLKIDGTEIIHWGAGHEEWETYETDLDAGTHTIEWTYKKDYSYNEDGDHAFLDNVYVGKPKFVVTFIDSFTYEEIPDSSIIVLEGTVLVPEDFPEPPEHEGYRFNSWNYDGAEILWDTYIYALYDVEITFCDWNGVPIYTELIPYDRECVEIDLPEEPEHNDYTFTGWSPEFENPHFYYDGPKTYTAQYEFNHPEDPDIIFKTDTVYTEPDENITIDFTLEALRPYECHAFTGFFYYEPSELTLIDNELIKGEVWQQIEELGGMVAVDTSVPGKIGFIVIMPNEGFTEDGIIFSMNFHVDGYHDWQGYSSPLLIEIAQFDYHPEGSEETPIVYDIENGSVNIYDMTFGDVNWDGRIDTTDVILIMRYTLGVQGLNGKYLAAADFNHDGAVDAVDALLLMRYIMSLG